MTQSIKPTTENASSEKQKFKPTVLQSILIGSVAGGTAVGVTQPFFTIRIRRQLRYGFTANPIVLWGGAIPNMMSMAPITAGQVGLNQAFKNLWGEPLSDWQRMGGSFVAGMGSSFISCPTDRVMIYQKVLFQRDSIKRGFYETAKLLVEGGGAKSFYPGLFATSLREAQSTVGFLAGRSIIKEKIQPYCGDGPLVSLAVGATTAATAMVVSQPIDTVKTLQQSVEPSQTIHVGEAIKKIYSTEGVYGFFRGGLARACLGASALTIMGEITERVEAELGRRNEESKATSNKKWF